MREFQNWLIIKLVPSFKLGIRIFTCCLRTGNFLYGFSAGKLNELLLVTKEAFFSNLAEDSDICKSFMTDFGGFFDLALLISGVTPFVILCKQNFMRDET